jgi:hypothetical protein
MKTRRPLRHSSKETTKVITPIPPEREYPLEKPDSENNQQNLPVDPSIHIKPPTNQKPL